MNRRPRFAPCLGAAAAVLLAVGCGTPPDNDAIAAAISAEDPESHMWAGISGTVALNRAGCLELEPSEPSLQPAVIVFPNGSSLNSDRTAVTVPEWGDVSIGDRIDNSGGWVTITSEDRNFVEQFPQPCRADRYVVINFTER